VRVLFVLLTLHEECDLADHDDVYKMKIMIKTAWRTITLYVKK